MSQDPIREQLDAIKDRSKKELAEFMHTVYKEEFNQEWTDDPSYDLLDAPIWAPPEDGQLNFSPGDSISMYKHEMLSALREQAGGWFYVKDGNLIFVTTEEWEKIKKGEREP